jgi:hypothetical protein
VPEDSGNTGSAPKADNSRVFDVARPGKTDPHPTSRPLIVGHRPLLPQDPMVKPGDKPDAKDLEAPSGLPYQIAVSGPEKPKETENGPTPEKKNQEPQTEPADSKPEGAAEPSLSGTPAQKDSETAEPKPNTNESNQAQAASQKAQQEAAARREELAKLAAAKTYALPISQKSTTRLLMAGVFALVGVLAVAVFVIMSQS